MRFQERKWEFSRKTTFRLMTLLMLAVWSTGASWMSAARAVTFPANNFYLQTSGQDRPPTIGDWYTSSGTSSTDRVHRFIIDVTQAEIDAAGGTAHVDVLDAESTNGPGTAVDEVSGAGDPTRYRLYSPTGTLLGDQIVPSGSPNGTTVTFNITAPGAYQLTAVDGSIPVYGARVGTDEDNDDNSYQLRIPGNNIFIGSLQTTYQHSNASNINANFYFLVGPGETSLYLRNFDYDAGSISPGVTASNRMVYTRPSGTTINGTSSQNGVWNGTSQTTNTGGDTISGLSTVTGGAPDAGVWQFNLQNWTPTNQVALEANGGVTGRLPLTDQPPTTNVGNFTITPDTTLATSIGVPVDHPFTVKNLFFTNDIINFTLSNTNPTYTVQLLNSNGTPLTDIDGDGHFDTGILTPNQTKSFILRVTPKVGSTTQDATRITGVSFMNKKVNGTATFSKYVTKTTTLSAQGTISGTVYEDANANGTLDGTESGTGIANQYAKLIPVVNGTPATTATQAVAVNPSTGTYQFNNVIAGSYEVIIDDNNTLTDVTPSTPAGYIPTEAPTETRQVTLAASASSLNNNFGLFHGSKLTGNVFDDNGVGSGTPNNGVRDGGEAGVGGVAVALNFASSGANIANTTTDASGNYTFYIRNTVGAQPLNVVETNPSNTISTGAQVGNTGGTYNRATDTTTFTNNVGTTYSGVNFGDVPLNTFLTDNATTSTPGNAVFYKHAFTAGSGGTVAFNVTTPSTQTPTGTGFTQTVYEDTNGNGVIDAGEPILTPTTQITVTAGQVVNIIVKENIPTTAPDAAKDIAVVNAVFTYTNASPSLSSTVSNTDVTTVTTATGLSLVKSVNSATAKPGDNITYTIVYTNSSDKPMTGLVINDFTPAFTTFVSAAAGTPPAGLNAPVITAPTTPAGAPTGPIQWTFGGTLAPQATGSVTFVVKVNS